MSPTCSRWSFEQTNRGKEGVKAPVLCLCPASLVTEWARLPKQGKDAKILARLPKQGKARLSRQLWLELEPNAKLMWLIATIYTNGKIPSLYNQDRQSRKQSKGVMAYYWWWIRLTWNISGPNGLVCGLCGRITACSSRRVSKESCHVV